MQADSSMSTDAAQRSAQLPASRATSTALALVRSPYHAGATARALLALLVGLVVLLAVVPWQQSVSGTGRVVAYTPMERQQNVEAPIDGRVTKWLVTEGAHVKAGDLIVELSDNDPSLLVRLREERQAVRERLDAARARVQSIEDRIFSLSGSRHAAIAAAGSRSQMARDRLFSAQQAVSAAEATQKVAQLNLDRHQALYEKGLSSTRVLELADLESVRTQTDTDRARAALSAARSEAAAVRSDQMRTQTDMQALLEDTRAARAAALLEVANSSAELARIEVRVARQNTQAVKAPITGVILRLLGGLGGEMTKAGDPLAVLVPDTAERACEVWIDGNDMPLLSVDSPVRLQFEGWPAVQFVGWPAVAVGTFPGRVALIDSTDNGKGKFRVMVIPDPANPAQGKWPSGAYLRQGVRVNAWVLLGQVRLGYELWRQFNGFPPVIASDEPKAGGGKQEKKDPK